ncbi:hypothetical protein C8J56DRAFT_424709 [Mycena floridula]|nr:hypothetical protein C8J56DRAFT_424709 [Mycena floridula]
MTSLRRVWSLAMGLERSASIASCDLSVNQPKVARCIAIRDVSSINRPWKAWRKRRVKHCAYSKSCLSTPSSVV